MRLFDLVLFGALALVDVRDVFLVFEPGGVVSDGAPKLTVARRPVSVPAFVCRARFAEARAAPVARARVPVFATLFLYGRWEWDSIAAWSDRSRREARSTSRA